MSHDVPGPVPPENSSPVPGVPDPPAGGTQTRHLLSWPVPLIVSIVVMVLSLGGVAATVAYAANSGHAATPVGGGQRPGGGYTGVRPSGFPTGERPSGYPSGRPTNYPSGRPTDYPSGMPTDFPTDGSGGRYPGGVPTDMPTDGSLSGGGYGYGNGGQGGMPNGSFQGGNRPGGFYTNSGPAKATWKAWETGVVAGCGVLFLASLAWLIVSVRKHGKTVRTGHPGQLPPPESAGQGFAAPPPQFFPAPVDQVVPTPADQVVPTPADQVVPASADQAAPAPVDQAAPAPVDQVVPVPGDQVAPASPDSPDAISPEPADPPTGDSST
ncbi:MAG: PT domain-containing protein [Propionibacteriaceae bacterium]|nr:PT domain-containing protein [Propionibacteriaceae bacterium]